MYFSMKCVVQWNERYRHNSRQRIKIKKAKAKEVIKMAKTLNVKSNVKEEIRAKAKKLNIEGFLSKDFLKVKLNGQLLRGQVVGIGSNWKEINKNLNEFLNAETLDMYVEMENKINILIPDKLVNSINEFNKIQDKKLKLQEEIKGLEHQKIMMDDKTGIIGQMKIMEIELAIDSKKNELDEVKKAYFEAYRSGLENTQISEELSILAGEIANIRNEQVEEIEKEIELMNIKSEMLRKLSLNIDPLNDYKNMIESRIGMGNSSSEKAIKSSEMNIPFIQTLIK